MEAKRIELIVGGYNVEEEYLYKDVYTFIEDVAKVKKYENTLKALPLARRIHNGQYRKGEAKVNGKYVKLPYLLHCLKVCYTLILIEFPLTNEEKDILYTAGLLHDCVEERPNLFPRGGIELFEDYEFPMRAVEVIKLLTKQPGANEYELDEYFNKIKEDKLALLVKIADRSHNVEDLYNMKNSSKYIEETRKYFLDDGICNYGKDHFPELSDGIAILKSKILSLTEATETLIEKHNISIVNMIRDMQREAVEKDGEKFVSLVKIEEIADEVIKRTL